MKNRRQSKLLEIIAQEDIETQGDLLLRLRDNGFDVTQATISRDIKDLRLYKVLSDKGTYKYSSMSEPVDSAFSSKLHTIFKESVKSIDIALNLVIIKTLPGMAPAACSALDAMPNPMVAGTLAGDDTAFIALRSESAARGMMEQLRSILTDS